MATKVSNNLLIESLESRFNLSTIAGGNLFALRNPAPAKSSLTQTLKNKKSLITLKTHAASAKPAAKAAASTRTALGATTLSSTSATSLDVTAPSTLKNAQVEYYHGKPDIGFLASSGVDIEYTVTAPAAGNYSLSLGIASPFAGALSLAVNGSTQAQYSWSSTNDWQKYTTVTKNITLSAGTNIIKLTPANASLFNLNALALTPTSTTPTTTTSTSTSTTTTPPSTTTTTSITNQSPAGAFDASVNSQWMNSFNQLNIVAGNANDTISLSQSGSTIYVNVNGVTNAYTGSYGDIVVKAGSGSDNITVNSSVNVATLLYGGSGNDTLKNLSTGNATIVSIGGGTDTVTGNGSNTAFWVDASDLINASATERNAGDVHAVSAFYNGVSTSLAGQTFSEPTGTGTTTTIPNASLWGTGPSMADINQGQVADCYLLAPLQTMANTKAAALRQTAVDLGDGTYAVQFKRNGATTFVRVDGQLPSSGYYANGLMYAHPGASGTLWPEIIEKAYAEFRSNANSYSSLNWGYIGSTFADLGISYTAFGAGNSSALYSTIANAIGSGKGVTIGTNPSINSNAPLIGSHCYSVTAAWTDSSGTQWVTLRNPWGYDGAGSDANPADALVSMTISQLNANLSTGAIT